MKNPQRKCPECGKMFAGRSYKKFCCERCRMRFYSRQYYRNIRRREIEAKIPKPCLYCGKIIESLKRFRFCSDSCAAAWLSEKRREERKRSRQDTDEGRVLARRYRRQYALNQKQGMLPKNIQAVCPRCGVSHVVFFEYGWAGRTDTPVPKYCTACKRLTEDMFCESRRNMVSEQLAE